MQCSSSAKNNHQAARPQQVCNASAINSILGIAREFLFSSSSHNRFFELQTERNGLFEPTMAEWTRERDLQLAAAVRRQWGSDVWRADEQRAFCWEAVFNQGTWPADFRPAHLKDRWQENLRKWVPRPQKGPRRAAVLSFRVLEETIKARDYSKKRTSLEETEVVPIPPFLSANDAPVATYKWHTYAGLPQPPAAQPQIPVSVCVETLPELDVVRVPLPAPSPRL